MSKTDPSTWGFADWVADARALIDEAEQIHARMVAGESVHRIDFDSPLNNAVWSARAAQRCAVRDYDALTTEAPDSTGALNED